MPDCMCRGNNPNCFRCGGTGTIGQLNVNRDLSEEKFANDLNAIFERPSIRISRRKNRGKAIVTLQIANPHLAKLPAERLPCPHCGSEIRADRLERHITERCPKLRFSNPPKLEKHNESMTVPWLCPECFASVCPSEASQSEALEFLRAHEKEVHPGKSAKILSKPMRASQIPVPLILCSRCGEMVKENSTGLHSLSCNPSNRRPGALDIPVSQLGFTLLAQGAWNIQDVIKHYRNQSHALPVDLQGRKIDNSRLEKMASLRPLRCYIGKESWSGYLVFEFPATSRVVLECPFEGNATYVLSGDWKSMVRHTKLEMRRKFPLSHVRVVHSSDWFAKLRSSLRAS